LASKSNLDTTGIEVRPLCTSMEDERYDEVADNLSKRRRLNNVYSNYSLNRIAITLEVVSFLQELQKESIGLDV